MKLNWARGIAIGLILLPEPFTTPIGVVLLILSFAFRRKHIDTIKYVETLVRRYRNTMATSVQLQRVHKPTTSAQASYNTQVISWRDYIEKKTRADYQKRYNNDSRRMSDKIIHHVLRTSVPGNHPIVNTSRPHLTSKVVLPPPINSGFYSRLRPMKPAPRMKIIHHSLKRI